MAYNFDTSTGIVSGSLKELIDNGFMFTNFTDRNQEGHRDAPTIDENGTITIKHTSDREMEWAGLRFAVNKDKWTYMRKIKLKSITCASNQTSSILVNSCYVVDNQTDNDVGSAKIKIGEFKKGPTTLGEKDISSYVNSRTGIFRLAAQRSALNTFYWTYSDINFEIHYGYEVSLNCNSSQGTVTGTAVYSPGSSATLIATPKMGYSFVKWQEDGNTSATRVITVDEPKTYTAIFKLNTYNISYDLGAGSITPGYEYLFNNTQENGGFATYTVLTEDFTLPTNVEKPYYDFVGWKLEGSSDYSTTVKISKGSTSGDKTYIAVYAPTSYKINLDNVSGATCDDVSWTNTYNIETGYYLPSYSKKGYTFNGWCGEGIPENAPNSNVAMPTGTYGNKSYTASFTIINYDITYDIKSDASYPSGASNPKSYTVNSKKITLANPQRPGYNFEYWEEKIDGKSTDRKEAIMTIDAGSVGNRTYTAVYSTINYDIIYKYDQENDGISDLEKITNKDKLLQTFTTETNKTLTNPTRNGYKFLQWKETNSTVAKITPGETSNKTFTMEFEPLIKTVYGSTYPENVGTVTIYRNEGDYSKNQKDFTYQDDFKIAKLEVEYDNKDYEFKGWKRKNDVTYFSENLTATSIPLDYNDEKNQFVAVFERIEYSININMFDSWDNPGLYGEVVTNNENDIIKTSQTGIVTISNLRHNDVRKISIIPFTNLNNPEERYFFKNWGIASQDIVLEIKMDDSWSSNSKTIKVYFESIPLTDTIQTSEQDSQIIKYLIEKTIGSFVLKNSVNSLGSYGFYDCRSLEYLYMPGANAIGDRTFENCINLRLCAISSDEDGQIGLDTFRNCSNLNLLILPGEFVALNSLFSPLDDPTVSPSDYPNETQSLFKQKLGRIYINNKYWDYDNNCPKGKYVGTNWGVYFDIMRPIDETIYYNIQEGNT